MEYARHFVIGDIHGHAKPLESILAYISPEAGDRITLLGDYIDNGPDSREVLDTLIALQRSSNAYSPEVRALQGNHEVMLLAAVDEVHTSELLSYWCRYGGEATLKSFDAVTAADIPDHYVSWLRQLPLWLEDEQHIFVHAGVAPDKSLELQTRDALQWQHLKTPITHCSGKTLITGHTPRKLPLISSTFIGMDTDIARGGWLSCLDLNSGKLIQADCFGSLRLSELNAA